MLDRQQELLGYTKLWVDKPAAQVKEEIASYSLETQGAPDPYFFIIGNNKLISPLTGKLVDDSIERDSDVGAKEFEALQKIQKWAHAEESGIVFWISPPHSERSSQSKIIISQIVNEGAGKIVFNRAVLFDESAIDYNYETLVGSLAAYSLPDSDLPASIEDCRSKPIFTNLSDADWLTILEDHINIPEVWDQVRGGQDLTAKEKAIKDASQIYETLFGNNYPKGFDDDRVKEAVAQATSLKMFGINPGSCPPALLLSQQNQLASEFMVSHSVVLGESDKFVKNCGNCGAGIHKKINKGYVCPHCNGVYEGC